MATNAIPKIGSVTQSSRVDNSNVTLDTVTATAEYSGSTLNMVVTNGRSGSWGAVTSSGRGTASGSATTVTGEASRVQYRNRVIGKPICDRGVVAMSVFTNRLSNTGTDYMVAGLWAYVPDAARPTVEIGAFADGPDANLTPATYLTTEKADATYVGDAEGIYFGVDDGEQAAGVFGGDVALTLDFGASPMVSGAVTNFTGVEVDDNGNDVVQDFDGISLTLGAAALSTTNGEGGFFSGDVTGSWTEEGITYSDKWGGQFYGAEAGSATGTFGGSGTRTGNNPLSGNFVGIFGAYKQ